MLGLYIAIVAGGVLLVLGFVSWLVERRHRRRWSSRRRRPGHVEPRLGDTLAGEFPRGEP